MLILAGYRRRHRRLQAITCAIQVAETLYASFAVTENVSSRHLTNMVESKRQLSNCISRPVSNTVATCSCRCRHCRRPQFLATFDTMSFLLVHEEARISKSWLAYQHGNTCLSKVKHPNSVDTRYYALLHRTFLIFHIGEEGVEYCGAVNRERSQSCQD